jgi:hypothetical protein
MPAHWTPSHCAQTIGTRRRGSWRNRALSASPSEFSYTSEATILWRSLSMSRRGFAIRSSAKLWTTLPWRRGKWSTCGPEFQCLGHRTHSAHHHGGRGAMHSLRSSSYHGEQATGRSDTCLALWPSKAPWLLAPTYHWWTWQRMPRRPNRQQTVTNTRWSDRPSLAKWWWIEAVHEAAHTELEPALSMGQWCLWSSPRSRASRPLPLIFLGVATPLGPSSAHWQRWIGRLTRHLARTSVSFHCPAPSWSRLGIKLRWRHLHWTTVATMSESSVGATTNASAMHYWKAWDQEFSALPSVLVAGHFSMVAVEVVLWHFHQSRYRSSPLWFFCGEGL